MNKFLIFLVLGSMHLAAKTNVCYTSAICEKHHLGLLEGATEITPDYHDFNTVKNQARLIIKYQENDKELTSMTKYGPLKAFGGATDQKSAVDQWKFDLDNILMRDCNVALNTYKNKMTKCVDKKKFKKSVDKFEKTNASEIKPCTK